ncbi:hypothetical protein D3C77_615910 [compost metagenome]
MALQELGNLAGGDALDVASAGECLAHLGGVHIQLRRRLASGQQVALEVRRDVQGEGVVAGIHAAVHLVEVDQLRRQEERRLEGVDDAHRQR